MTGDAAAHADVALAPERIALGDGSVAGLAAGAGFQVRSMAERDIARDLIHANPGNGLPGRGELLEGLDGWLVFRNLDMAGHAFGGGRESHHFAGVGVLVALLAFESGGGVLFMAKREGLPGRSGLGKECGGEDWKQDRETVRREGTGHSAAMIAKRGLCEPAFGIVMRGFAENCRCDREEP